MIKVKALRFFRLPAEGSIHGVPVHVGTETEIDEEVARQLAGEGYVAIEPPAAERGIVPVEPGARGGRRGKQRRGEQWAP